MSDEIRVVGIRARGRHGVFPEERRDGQEFVVDVTLTADLRAAGESDDLAATVDYSQVAEDVVARVTGPAYDLIESLAERIAEDALTRDLVAAVEVTVHKPQAPIRHTFGDVFVRVRRERDVPVVIALGANLGDPVRTLTAAIHDLRALPGLSPVAISPLVETDPVGGPDQPVYLNAVLLARTSLAPGPLLAAMHTVEARHGRVRDIRWGARTLDLDLVQYGVPGTPSEVVRDEATLRLPHPRAHERAFVLRPWHAVDPQAVVRVPSDAVGLARPVRGALGDGPVRRVSDVLGELDEAGVRVGPAWDPLR
jgi:dihydroneopterin aldolase/2-amino-4-hydroxy-6-hydroxymethyldihydropteridine diphosphokinase